MRAAQADHAGSRSSSSFGAAAVGASARACARAGRAQAQVGVEVGLHGCGRPGPLPCTSASSMPSSQARRRTAGEAIGVSAGGAASLRRASRARAGDAGGGGLRRRRRARRFAAGGGARRCRRRGWRLRRPAPPRLPARRAASGASLSLAGAISTSMRISSAPTASIWPTSPPSAITRPATGDGISTVGLVGHHVGQRLVFGDRVAGLDVPGDESRPRRCLRRCRACLITVRLIGHVMPPSSRWRPRRPAPDPESRPTPARADTACPSR